MLFFSILAGLIYQLVVFLPSVEGPDTDLAFQTVLGVVPRVLIGGWLAIYLGGISNNYIMHFLKSTNTPLAFRTITSTIVGEFVNTAVFFTIGLGGILSQNILIQSIIWSWILKVLIEVLMTPITYIIISKLQKYEYQA